MKECFTYEIPIRSTASAVVGLSHRGSRVASRAAAAMRQPYRSTVAGEVCYTYKTATIAAGGLAGGVSSSIAGGEFIDGLCNGLICAGLNHALHYVVEGVTGPDDPPGKKNNNAKQLQERANNASAVVGTEATMVQKAAVLTELMEGEANGLKAIYRYAGKVGRWCLGINVGVNYTLAIKGEISFLSATMRTVVGFAEYASFQIPYAGPLVGGGLLYYDITRQFENTLYNDIWLQEHVITPAQQYLAPNYSDYGNTPIYYRHGK